MTVEELIKELEKYPKDAEVEHEYVRIGSVDYKEDIHTVELRIFDCDKD